MAVRRVMQSLLGLAAASTVYAQCYDLASSRVYQPQGRFIERWKDSDFRVDNGDWGDVMQFALFSGVVRKSASGWQPYRASRKIKYLCEPGVQPNGGWKCFGQPYFQPTPEATIIRYPRSGLETWSLSENGTFHYEKTERGALAPSGDHEMMVRATLDLNTGKYDVDMRVHAAGVHKHLKASGIELWREQPFHANVRLREVPCGVKSERVALHTGGIETPNIQSAAAPPCVVKVKEFSGQGLTVVPTKWEFLHNPVGVPVPDSCVWVFDGSVMQVGKLNSPTPPR